MKFTNNGCEVMMSRNCGYIIFRFITKQINSTILRAYYAGIYRRFNHVSHIRKNICGKFILHSSTEISIVEENGIDSIQLFTDLRPHHFIEEMFVIPTQSQIIGQELEECIYFHQFHPIRIGEKRCYNAGESSINVAQTT